MEDDDLRSIGLLAYDERTETWYIHPRDSRRLVLNRETLDGFVRLYNSVHSGNPLQLKDALTLNRLEETNRLMSETIHDLCHQIDQERQNRPHRVLLRLIAAARNRILGR